MPREKKFFGEIDCGEVFSSTKAGYVENPFPDRPHLWLKIGDNLAFYLPGRYSVHFDVDEVVKLTAVEIKEKK